jgi:hypothetical protein
VVQRCYHVPAAILHICSYPVALLAFFTTCFHQAPAPFYSNQTCSVSSMPLHKPLVEKKVLYAKSSHTGALPLAGATAHDTPSPDVTLTETSTVVTVALLLATLKLMTLVLTEGHTVSVVGPMTVAWPKMQAAAKTEHTTLEGCGSRGRNLFGCG